MLLLTLSLRVVTPAPATAQSAPLLIAAAASLQNALEELDPIFEVCPFRGYRQL